MSKRKYTHVQALLPEIKAMVEAGKTQREIAEHYDFSNKSVVKKLLGRERKRRFKGFQSSEIANLQRHWLSINTKTNDSGWKMNCCGIFCNPQKGSEGIGKVRRYPSSLKEVSSVCYVPVFQRITEWLL